jgi:hypothetical protein
MNVLLKDSLEIQAANARQPPRTLELDWPICMQARCATCQHLWSPKVRVAVLRRRLTCPSCGGSQLHSIKTLSTLTASDSAARFTPAELGFPQDHLFTLCPTPEP